MSSSSYYILRYFITRQKIIYILHVIKLCNFIKFLRQFNNILRYYRILQQFLLHFALILHFNLRCNKGLEAKELITLLTHKWLDRGWKLDHENDQFT